MHGLTKNKKITCFEHKNLQVTGLSHVKRPTVGGARCLAVEGLLLVPGVLGLNSNSKIHSLQRIHFASAWYVLATISAPSGWAVLPDFSYCGCPDTSCTGQEWEGEHFFVRGTRKM